MFTKCLKLRKMYTRGGGIHRCFSTFSTYVSLFYFGFTFYPRVHTRGPCVRCTRKTFLGSGSMFFRVYHLHEVAKRIYMGVHPGNFQPFDPKNHWFTMCLLFTRVFLARSVTGTYIASFFDENTGFFCVHGLHEIAKSIPVNE